MTSTYRYVFSTLRAENVVQEIDLYGVYMSATLNGGNSQFDGTFQLDQTGKRNEDLIAATEPGRTFVVVERNGVPIGGWIIWSRVYSAQSKTVQMHGIPFDTYPDRQRILTDFIQGPTEQVTLFKNLWNHMMAVPGRNINVNVPFTLATPIQKSVEVHAYDVKYYGEVMSSVADSTNGFDWYVTFTKEGNFYRKDLRIGYPTLGTGAHPGMITFEYPGNITQYYMTESMADSGTHVLVLGAGEGADMLTREVAFNDLIAGGMPRWDTEIPRKDVQSQSLLDSIAGAAALTVRSPITTVKCTVKGDAIPPIGSYSLGDTARLVIKDPRNPFGFQKDARLIAWALRPPTSEQVEEADLVFEGDDPSA